LTGVLRRLPGILIYADPEHGTYDEYKVLVRQLGISMPPAVTIVRNPWEWYVERWCRVRGHPMTCFFGSFSEYLEEVRRGERFPDFRTQTWCLMEWLGANDADDVIRFENLFDEIVRIVLKYARDNVMAVYDACGQGPVERMTAEEIVRYFISQEWHYRPALTPEGEPPGDYKRYYTEENRRWVEEWDEIIIKGFGYTFD